MSFPPPDGPPPPPAPPQRPPIIEFNKDVTRDLWAVNDNKWFHRIVTGIIFAALAAGAISWAIKTF